MKQTCSKCGIEKELDFENFCRHKLNKSDFDTQCKQCKKESDATRYKENKQRILEEKKKYYQANKERIKERQRNYHRSKKSSL